MDNLGYVAKFGLRSASVAIGIAEGCIAGQCKNQGEQQNEL